MELTTEWIVKKTIQDENDEKWADAYESASERSFARLANVI